MGNSGKPGNPGPPGHWTTGALRSLRFVGILRAAGSVVGSRALNRPRSRRRAGRRGRRSGGHRSSWQRGLSNSVQWAVLFPAVMLCTLGIIQAGIWVHGRNVAVEAANTAADLSRGLSADDGSARTAAERVAAVGGLTDVQLEVDRGPTQVVVTFRGRIPMFFDVGLGAITETAQAPVERVTTP